jgi:L-lactate dehydrogenase complex protein LldG
VGAHWTVVRGEADAACALARVLTEAGARRVAISDAPAVRQLVHALPQSIVVEDVGRLSRDALFACDAGVTTAQWGIAATGTLVLESAREQSRLLSLVPPLHVALLPAARLCHSMGDALARVGQVGPTGLTSHAITFITGPSRTSDIELTLVVGVHGPATLHVLLLEDA